MLKKNKTTPQNVKEAHEALFHAKMNLPDAADHWYDSEGIENDL